MECDIAALLCLLTFRGPFTEELATAIDTDIDRVLHRSRFLRLIRTPLFHFFPRLFPQPISLTYLHLFSSPSLFQPFLHPDSPYSPPHEGTRHAPTTTYTIFTCRSSSCETIDIGLTRSPRNHPLRQSTSPNRSLSGLEETRDA